MKYKFLNTWSKFMTIVVVLLTASASAHAGLIYQYTFTHTYNNVLGTTTGKIFGLEDNSTGHASNITMETYNREWLPYAGIALSTFDGIKTSEYTMENGVLTNFSMYYSNKDMFYLGGPVEHERILALEYTPGNPQSALGTIIFKESTPHRKIENTATGPLTISVYAPLVTEVPEPPTLAIFALGLMALVSRRFKKQS
jgi:hypothetical protein